MFAAIRSGAIGIINLSPLLWRKCHSHDSLHKISSLSHEPLSMGCGRWWDGPAPSVQVPSKSGEVS
jgi:hypothetical protein